LDYRGIGSVFFSGGADDTQIGHFPYTVQSAVCVPLISVITKDSISVFTQQYCILCIHM